MCRDISAPLTNLRSSAINLARYNTHANSRNLCDESHRANMLFKSSCPSFRKSLALSIHQKCSGGLARVNQMRNSFPASPGFGLMRWVSCVGVWVGPRGLGTETTGGGESEEARTSWSPRWGCSRLGRSGCCGRFAPRLCPPWTGPSSRTRCVPPGSWTAWENTHNLCNWDFKRTWCQEYTPDRNVKTR